MTEADIKHRLGWLAIVACSQNWAAAARLVVARTRAMHPDLELNLLRDGSLRDASGEYLTRIAQALEANAVLAAAWRLLALQASDPTLKKWEVIASAQGLLKMSEGDITEAMTRLEAWKTAELGDGPADFFRAADVVWRHRVDAGADTPTCVLLLEHDTWQGAFERLSGRTLIKTEKLGIKPPAHDHDRKKQRATISWLVEELFDRRTDECGDLALAWQMMMCDPEKQESFTAVMPQLTWMLRHRTSVTERGRQTRMHDRLQVWWLAARGEWAGSKAPVSIFRIAKRETAGREYVDDFPLSDDDDEPEDLTPPAPSVVVMRKDRAEEKGLPQAWRDLRDQALPLVVCRDAAEVRARLQEEYPHAGREITMLMQDLRSGEPAWIKPTILLGPPGAGKSRLVRRFAEIVSPDLYVSRFDASGTFDGTYAGTPKSWSSSQPSVPARAILASRTANPVVLVDEIEKASESTHNGNLWSAMTPFLERETSRRHRESGIEAELDLSHVVHLATANSVERLPSQLRDRFRVIKVPAPTLGHLPRLAALVMRDLTSEDEARAHDEPLAVDELEIIGRAWARERFSMRKLQRLVGATLEARDQCARRH